MNANGRLATILGHLRGLSPRFGARADLAARPERPLAPVPVLTPFPFVHSSLATSSAAAMRALEVGRPGAQAKPGGAPSMAGDDPAFASTDFMDFHAAMPARAPAPAAGEVPETAFGSTAFFDLLLLAPVHDR